MKTSQMLKVIPIATLALLMSCSGNKSEEATETQNEKVKVKVETVSVQDVEQLSEFTATVEANIKNNIAPQTPFRIEKIFAEVGDHVKAGQLLAKMDATSLKQAKIQLDNQEIEFKRIDELYKVGGASKSAWKARIDRPCICGDRDLRTFFLKQVISGLASGDRDEHHHGDDGLSRRQRFGYRDECFEALGKRVE